MDINKYLTQLNDTLESTANKDIAYAMNLYYLADDDLKSLGLRLSGFGGEISDESLRSHFDTLELLDELTGLGGYIDNMESNMELDGLVPSSVPGHPDFIKTNLM